MNSVRFTILVLLVVPMGLPSSALPQTQSRTYSETRRLLLKMERYSENQILRKLFEEGEARETDLIRALYDDEQKVSLSAQVIIRYLAEPHMLSALQEWFEYRKRNSRDYWMTNIELFSEAKYLEGGTGDPTKRVLKTLHPSKDAWAKIIAFNNRTKTALIEVVIGNVFTEGWHVVVKKENGKWRLLSNSLVWQS